MHILKIENALSFANLTIDLTFSITANLNSLEKGSFLLILIFSKTNLAISK